MVNKKFITSMQFISTLITFFFGFLLPLLSYAQLYPIFDEAEELSYLQPVIVFNSIFSIIIGGLLTGLRYIAFYFNKHTLKRAIINFTSGILVLLLLMSSAQLSVIHLNVEGSSLFLDVGGVFLLLIVSWTFVVFKTIYDVIEIKLTFRRKVKPQTIERVRSRTLIPCLNCKYMCRIKWKKCPICNSVLYNK